MATKLDVIKEALRFIGVTAIDEVPTASEYATAERAFESVTAGLWPDPVTYHPDSEIDDRLVEPLAEWLGAVVAPRFGVPSAVSVSGAKLRVLAQMRPDNRDAVDPEYY